jgi:3'(2'), 5'-bisphosphate nucleotidase
MIKKFYNLQKVKFQMTEAILPILREAGKAILEIYADESRFNTEIKGDSSPLTEADRRANKIICDALTDIYPDIPIISEENKEAPYSERAGYEKFFLVDPLDGTKEFIKRNGEFTVNIAYVEGHSPVGGFVYVPCTGVAYMAEQAKGAFSVSGENLVTALKSRPFSLMDEGLKLVASRSHRDHLTEKIMSCLNAPDIVSTGSSLKFLLIAEGKAHFYPRLAPTMEWDTAAAQCVLEESGGSVLQFDTLSPLVYNKENLRNPYFIATGSLLDPETLTGLLQKL